MVFRGLPRACWEFFVFSTIYAQNAICGREGVQDRKQTGNIAEYFRRTENTPKPEASVFASAQMRGGLEASRPRASTATDVTGHSTEVLDVDAAPNSEILAGFLAEYGSGSEGMSYEEEDACHMRRRMHVI
jgi:hypothetical protein